MTADTWRTILCRAAIRERQRGGIALAKQRGAYTGRKKAKDGKAFPQPEPFLVKLFFAFTALDSEAVKSVIRITGVNFRLFGRLLTQIERLAQINNLTQVSKEAVEAARESLVIGQT